MRPRERRPANIVANPFVMNQLRERNLGRKFAPNYFRVMCFRMVSGWLPWAIGIREIFCEYHLSDLPG